MFREGNKNIRFLLEVFYLTSDYLIDVSWKNPYQNRIKM